MTGILTFGEILIRQQSLGENFFNLPNNQLEIFPGGSEANVAAALGQMGDKVYYSSAFPDNALTHEIITLLNKLNVDTSKSVIQGDRIGLYILMSANGLSKGDVIYDRKYSSFSHLQTEDLDFDTLFEGISWFHWTALTPALNQDMANVMLAVLKEAAKREIHISVDLNYRSKLWQYDKLPIDVMPELIAHCDVIMGNIWAANVMLGTAIAEGLDRNTPQEPYIAEANRSAAELFSNYPKCQHIAYTYRFMDNPSHNLFYATYHTRSDNFVSETLETEAVVDRIGSGDAFMAGLIHALVNDFAAEKVIETATNAGFNKLFVKGDFGDGTY